MTPVREKRWRVDQKPSFEDVEIRVPEEWENDHRIDEPVYHRRPSAGLWTALASLAVVVAVMAAYGYSVLSNQNDQLAWLPGLIKSVSAVRDRTNGLEASVKQWSGRQEQLATKVQQLGSGWQAGLNGVREHAASLVNKAYQKEHAELSQREAALDARIVEMASRQQAEQNHVAQLEKQLTSTRQELASVRESYTRELAALQLRQISNQRAIVAVGKKLSTGQVNFEASKNHDAAIVPGVTLHLTATNTSHQRFRGWILLAGKGQKIWVRRQAVETPIVFYPVPGGEAYELVVTRVERKSVAGYMLVPGSSEGQSASVASDESASELGHDRF